MDIRIPGLNVALENDTHGPGWGVVVGYPSPLRAIVMWHHVNRPLVVMAHTGAADTSKHKIRVFMPLFRQPEKYLFSDWNPGFI